MKINEIPRTATFAWAPSNRLVTGTAAGAIDADFNSSTQLELWDSDSSTPLFSTECDARFTDIAAHGSLVAGAMENSTVNLWKIADNKLASVGSGSSTKGGAARAVAFNADARLVSAGTGGEVLVWDTANMSASSPGSTARQDDIVSVAWNNRVKEILATAGTGGFTSIWDLRKNREVIHLHYTVAGTRLPAHGVSWHASNSTKLVTCSSDDQNPVVLVWDLRNANSPEAILEGHTAGVLSVDWCQHDADLLISSGKDNRTLLWNPTTQQLLAEYPISVGWTFKTRFNPALPDLFASASFDGKISVETLQDTSEPSVNTSKKATGDAFWDSEEVVDAVHPQYFVRQAPAWLKRPVSCSFGFGGKLVTTSGNTVNITTVKASATDTAELKQALAGDFASLVDQDGSDWVLLKKLYEKKPLFEEPEQDGAPEEDDAEDFPIQYNPSGDYKLFDGKHDKITKLVLAGKLAKAVDVLIAEGEFGDALALASYDPALVERARNAYLDSATKPYLRAAWAIKNNLADFGNAELDAWKQIVSLSQSDKEKTATLGKRLLEAGRRDDALAVFLTGGNFAEAGSIWLSEAPKAESEIIRQEKQTVYQAHARALQQVIGKVLVASNAKALEADSVLYDAYRDFADIAASQGDLDVASKLLDLLPTSYATAKERISGGKKPVKTAAKTPGKTNKYVQPFAGRVPPSPVPATGIVPGASFPGAPGPGVIHPPGAPGTLGASAAAGAGTPLARSTASPAPRNPYAPVNPYTPATNPTVPAPPKFGAAQPIPGAMQPPQPSTLSPPPRASSNFVSTTIKPPAQGWNDLPEQTMMKNRRTPTAPSIIPGQYVDPNKSAAAPPRRASSTGPVPPVPSAAAAAPSAAPSAPVGPRPPASNSPAPRANPYAPSAPSGSTSGASTPGPGVAASAVPAANPYAPAPNPYAPAPNANPYGPASTGQRANLASPTPAAPRAAPAPPPPGKARSGAAPAPAAVAAALPVTESLPVASEDKKHPVGDRSHIPEEAKQIYTILSATIERVSPSVTAQYPRQMKDTERRLNILFEHLNNETLLTPATIAKLDHFASALKNKRYDEATMLQTEIATSHADECGQWMTGLKRLIEMDHALVE